MTDALDLIGRLHQHRRWTNDQLRVAAGELSDDQLRRRFDIGQGSVLDTMIHLYAAEYAWLEAIQGNPEPPAPTEVHFDSFEQLLSTWPNLERRWQRYLDALTPAMLDRDVRKTSSTQPGVIRKNRLSDVLLHVCTHAQYTSAQAVNLMRRVGLPQAKLPDSMLITMARQETPSP